MSEQRPGPDPVTEGRAILAEAVERFRPLGILSLFSGGDDSKCATAIAAEHPLFISAVLADTGIAVEEAHEHARAVCAHKGWPLRVQRTRESYDKLVLEHGFPGPAMHYKMYQRLKERAFQAASQHFKAGRRGKMLLVGGRRRAESPRRLQRLVEPIEVPRSHGVSSAVFVSPLFYWDRDERDAFRASLGLEPNPVKAKLCSVSGDCLCGAMADQDAGRGERARLAHFYPHIDARLVQLEDAAKAHGVWYEWGVKPPKEFHKATRQSVCVPYGCTGCEWRAEQEIALAELNAELLNSAEHSEA